jgi:colicin import membrane protein
MAREGISYEQVAAAADALVGAGQSPTIKSVREAIGTGSPNTVHRHLVAWRAARPAAQAVARTLPGPIVDAISLEIQRAAADARAELEAQLVQVQAEARELSAAGESLEVQNGELADQVHSLTNELATALATAAERSAEIERLARELKREQSAAEGARVELAKATLKTESSAERLLELSAEVAKLRTALDAEKLARTEAEQAAAVGQARLEAAQERAQRADARVDALEAKSVTLTERVKKI